MKIPFLLRRIIRKGVSETLKYFYLLTFRLRKKDVSRFDELVNEKDIFFTIELEKAGFTDQLIQFSVFHNLGTFLNLKYVHTNLNSSRSFSKTEHEYIHSADPQNPDRFEDVYDYLGLNSYLFEVSHTVPTSKDIKSVILDIEDDSYYFNRGIAEKDLLVTYLKLLLTDELFQTDSGVIIKFRLKGHSSFFRLFNVFEVYRKLPFNLREIYTEKREKTPQILLHKEGTYSLFVHIRQGDTAVIETPWNTHVLVWETKKNAFKEYSTSQEIGDENIISLEYYYSFIEELSQHFDPHFFSTRIYSDGFHRTFQTLYDKQERMDWSDQQIAQLRAYEKTYDQKAFNKFTELHNLKICIGEGNTKLYELIHSLLQAQVVIIGTQQRMIPKFLSVYCDPSNMPIVIVLTNKKFSSLQSFGREELQPFYIQAEQDNYNSQLIAEKIKIMLDAK